MDRRWQLLLAADIILINLVVGVMGWLKYSEWRKLASGDRPGRTEQTQPADVDTCGPECRRYIDQKVLTLARPTGIAVAVPSPTLEPVPTAKPTAKATKPAAVTKKTRSEEILTIPGVGSGTGSEWADVAGTNFYFDTRDYPGLVEVYFEANIRLVNGNGYGFVRLYDGTNNIAVAGAENNTASQADVWTKSQRVNFWNGNNLMRVQARTLTADTVVYNQGRLRIVVER